MTAFPLVPMRAQFTQVTPVSQMERLDRGLIVIPCGGKHYVSWRLLGTDDMQTSFDIVRDGATVAAGITGATFLELDDAGSSASYQVKTYQNGVLTETSSAVKPWAQSYLRLKLDQPSKTSTDAVLKDSTYHYTPNDCSVGDVDGDGQYELIVKWYPTNAKDNSQSGYTGYTYFDCYKIDPSVADGCRRLWRIDLGKNMRSGAHYNQFLVYDFDGDGKAELMCKTAPGSIDGQGNYVSAAATNTSIRNVDNTADYRVSGGRINGGHEYLTVFNGETGAAIHTIPYLPTRNAAIELSDAAGTVNWYINGTGGTAGNDRGNYGNRAERYLATVAHLDGAGQNPSAVFTRGYYTYAFLWAVDFDGTKLSNKWVHYSESFTKYHVYTPKASDNSSFDKVTYTCSSNKMKESPYSEYANNGCTAFAQGTHSIAAGDTDGDGKDEIMFGGAAINADGRLRYSTGVQHGDAHHLSDLDPDRPGLEFFMVHEDGPNYGHHLRDASTGEILDYKPCGEDNGRGLAADVLSESRGFEYWSAMIYGMFLIDGTQKTFPQLGMNFRTYWDGKPYDQLLSGYSITKVSKSGARTALGVGDDLISALGSPGSCNGSKDTPCLSADIFGDWREELILYDTSDNATLNVYSTVIPTDYRVPTLMHDHTYRLAVAWQNVGYNQPPHLGYYLPDYLGNFNDMSQIEIIDPYAEHIVEPEITRTDWTGLNSDNVYMPIANVAIGAYEMNGVLLKPAATASFTNLDGTITAVDENIIYSEDYEKMTELTGWKMWNTENYLSLPSESSNKYLYFEQSGTRSTRWAYNDLELDLNDVATYAVEFDLAVHQGSRDGNEFCVMAMGGTNPSQYWDNYATVNSNANLLFDMTSTGNSNTYTITGSSTTLTVPNGEWHHYSLVVNKDAGTVEWQIDNVGSGAYAYSGSGDLRGFYMVSGRYNSYIKLDNVKIYKIDTPNTLLTINYEDATDASSWTAVTGGDLSISLTQNDAVYGSYINLTNKSGSGGRTAYTNFYSYGNDPYGDSQSYTLEFDAMLHYGNKVNNDIYLFGERQSSSSFSVGSNYLFKLSADGSGNCIVEGDGGAFGILDTARFKCWYHFTVTVDKSSGTLTYTVAPNDGNSAVLFTGAYQLGSSVSRNIQGMFVTVSRGQGFIYVDNVKVTTSQTASDFAYTFTEPGTLTVTADYPGITSSVVTYDSEIGTKLSSLDASTFAYNKVGLSFSGLDMYAVSLNSDGKSVELTPVDAIPAGEAVLLRKQGDNDLSSDYIYPGDMVRSAATLSGNDLIAVPDGGMTGESGDIYVLNQVNGKTGFYKLKSDGTVAYGKGYLQLSGQDVKGIVFGADELDDDTPTGINAPQGDVAGKAAVVYDLSGRRVTNPGKGIYIVNGKKVVIK